MIDPVQVFPAAMNAEAARALVGAIPVDAWAQRLGKGALQDARAVIRGGGVSDFEWHDSAAVSARVQAGGIRVRVRISMDADSGQVDARCSCALSFDCVHALAVGVVLQQAEQSWAKATEWRERLDAALASRSDEASGESLALHLEFSPGEREVWLTPLRQGIGTPWVKKRASWSELNSPWESVTASLNAQHVQALGRIYQVATQAMGYAGAHHIALSALGVQAFSLLEYAQQVGVVLLADPVNLEYVHLESASRPVEIQEDLRPAQSDRFSDGQVAVVLTPVTSTLPAAESAGAEAASLIEADDGVEMVIGNVGICAGGTRLRHIGQGAFAGDPLKELGQIMITGQDIAHYLAVYAQPLRKAFPVRTCAQINALTPQVVARFSLDERGYNAVLSWQVHYTLESNTVTYLLSQPPATSTQEAAESRQDKAADTLRSQAQEASTSTNLRQLDRSITQVIAGVLDKLTDFVTLTPVTAVSPSSTASDAQARSNNGAKGWERSAENSVQARVFPAYQLHDALIASRRLDYLPIEWDFSAIPESALQPSPTADQVATISVSISDVMEQTQDDAVDGHTDGSPAQTDWFDLHAAIRIGGEDIPMRQILSALERNQQYYWTGRRWVDLDCTRLAELREALQAAHLLSPSESHTRITRWQAHLWRGLEAIADHTQAAPRWINALVALPHSGQVPALPLVESLTARLRPYQYEGHHWLTSLMRAQLGGILADDMGLGKTLQVLAAVASYTNSRARLGQTTHPILVIAPTSVLGVWGQETARWYPHMRVVTVGQTSKKRGTPLADLLGKADLVVTTYAITRIDDEEFADQQWGGCIIDEAHTVKNPRTAAFRAIARLTRPWTIALTGTPVENSVTDLWAMMRLTCPGLLPGWARFTSRFVTPIEKDGNTARSQTLRATIAPFLLRRTKDTVATDLPDKIDTLLPVTLDEEPQRYYRALLNRERTTILGLLDSGGSAQIQILASLTRLRQAAVDPGLIDSRFAGVPSAKTQELLDILRQIIPGGHQALVFSQFTSYLERIGTALDDADIPYVTLDGNTRHRERVIQRFRDGEARVFLISLKAGGTGLTLTEADYVFMMDPWWNPAAEEQAIDRAHRIGQTRPVTIYRMVAQGTIEEKVLTLQERKRALAHTLVGDSAHSGYLNADDIRALIG